MHKSIDLLRYGAVMTALSDDTTLRPSRRSVLALSGAAGVAGLLGATTRPLPAYADTPAGSPILKPTPAELFRVLGTNAEMRWDSVGHDRFTTPQARLFVRDHTRTPRIDAATWRLEVHGDGLRRPTAAGQGTRLGLADLRRLPVTRATTVHECTGNGRSFFASQQGAPAPGTQWGLGAVGVVTWEGVLLRDVLRHLGVRRDAVDVMATGLDPDYVDKGVDHGPVRRPVPIDKALDDVLLAWGANGRDLLPDHGAPVRLVVPGWVGIASIKWLGSLEVSRSTLTSPWNTTWYRMTGPGWPADSPPLTLNPVRSAWELADGARLPRRGGARLTGRSWSGAGPIRRVEVSVDGGRWHPVRLEDRGQAWTRWTTRWPGATPGDHTLRARATDVLGRTQPLVAEENDNGYFFDAVVRHRVVVG